MKATVSTIHSCFRRLDKLVAKHSKDLHKLESQATEMAEKAQSKSVSTAETFKPWANSLAKALNEFDFSEESKDDPPNLQPQDLDIPEIE